MDETSKSKLLFEGQGLHVTALAALLIGVYLLRDIPGFDVGGFLGLSTKLWVILAIADAVVHQVYVWLCWRAELHGKHLTRWFGAGAFNLYAVMFSILILLRPILLFTLGWSNRGTLEIAPWLGYAISALLFGPAAYMMFSVVHYFSFRRAFGIDHFDDTWRGAPLVRQGIFRWSPNSMYVFGFCALWIPAFLFQSVAALIIAGFSHAYIWVHYYATEKPDMRRIYGSEELRR